MTLEFVVIGFYKSPVNKSMLLALTEINVLGSFAFNTKVLKGKRILFSVFLESENLSIIFSNRKL